VELETEFCSRTVIAVPDGITSCCAGTRELIAVVGSSAELALFANGAGCVALAVCEIAESFRTPGAVVVICLLQPTEATSSVASNTALTEVGDFITLCCLLNEPWELEAAQCCEMPARLSFSVQA
jgi:hypothetical protein